MITYHWELKESCGGIPYRMIALRKAFLWRALKPRTWNTTTVELVAVRKNLDEVNN